MRHHLCLLYRRFTPWEGFWRKQRAAWKVRSSQPQGGPTPPTQLPRARVPFALPDFGSCHTSSNFQVAAVWPPSAWLLVTPGEAPSCCPIPAWNRGRGPHRPRRLTPLGRSPSPPLSASPLRPWAECVCLARICPAWQGVGWRFKPDVQSPPRRSRGG